LVRSSRRLRTSSPWRLSFAAALVIHRLSGEVHLADIREAVSTTPWPSVVQAVAFTLFSFAAVALYDVVATGSILPQRVPARLAAFAGLVGYGISNTIGFHVLVGGPIRYRVYAMVGLDAADVGRIVGFSLLTYSLGVTVVVGVAFLADPVGVPFLHGFSPLLDRALGMGLLLALASTLLWLSMRRRELSLLGWRFPLPGGKTALLQMLIGAADVTTAAAALYVLWIGALANITGTWALRLADFVRVEVLSDALIAFGTWARAFTAYFHLDISIFIAITFPIAFLTTTARRGRDRLAWTDVVLAALSFTVALYYIVLDERFLNWSRGFSQPSAADIAVGLLLIVLVVELCRRSTGCSFRIRITRRVKSRKARSAGERSQFVQLISLS
jgi:uncharacterized membrane protein YbhN (UPF0104 family)